MSRRRLGAGGAGTRPRARYRAGWAVPVLLLTYSSDFGAARLDPCELRTVVPYTYTLSERSAELHGVQYTQRRASARICAPNANTHACTHTRSHARKYARMYVLACVRPALRIRHDDIASVRLPYIKLAFTPPNCYARSHCYNIQFQIIRRQSLTPDRDYYLERERRGRAPPDCTQRARGALSATRPLRRSGQRYAGRYERLLPLGPIRLYIKRSLKQSCSVIPSCQSQFNLLLRVLIPNESWLFFDFNMGSAFECYRSPALDPNSVPVHDLKSIPVFVQIPLPSPTLISDSEFASDSEFEF
ncbi:hypothetical protein EVAR_12080_1 [Eumeta japonica]|uniref:Uncharacterized protein n=1 Tax=Eumeta variegata TaxID=151549 RepID=A0A4C1U5A1_EUMVA|nr:hypothetical protein EVAR_12080_1 [Eumeta japonica]